MEKNKDILSDSKLKDKLNSMSTSKLKEYVYDLLIKLRKKGYSELTIAKAIKVNDLTIKNWLKKYVRPSVKLVIRLVKFVENGQTFDTVAPIAKVKKSLEERFNERYRQLEVLDSLTVKDLIQELQRRGYTIHHAVPIPGTLYKLAPISNKLHRLIQ